MIPTTAQRISIAGSCVTFERSIDSPTGWCATAWEQGLPVARRPITVTEDYLAEILSRYSAGKIHYS